MGPPPRLLLVEDDPELVALLQEILLDEGYAVDVAGDGERGLELGLTKEYDVLVLDRGLPGVEGLDLLARLRRRGRFVPVLVLSAQGTARDRVAGLDAGAEDYLVKPFDVDELLARLRALRRRHEERAERLRVPGGSLSLSSPEVLRDDGARAALSAREHLLLCQLARFPRRIFSREELLVGVFDGASDPGLVDTYVHYLRRKLDRRVVRTVRGVGYQLGDS
ncbi:MAG: response regulator transcription factor [Actinomycetota bacterium]|nr:response regulator transcription factor [Actinomycetota bacterium]